VVADEAQAYCPRAEGLVPWVLPNSCCPDTYELPNKWCSEPQVRQIRLQPHQMRIDGAIFSSQEKGPFYSLYARFTGPNTWQETP
jgi:hypothetical protein